MGGRKVKRARLSAQLEAEVTFGGLMRAVRAARGLSLEAMGVELGISRGTLCDVEYDRRAVSAQRAARWAEALGYDPKPFVRRVLQAELDAAGLRMRVRVG